MSQVLYPWGYGTEYKSIEEIREILLWHYHPEYVERLCAYLVYKRGRLGIGGRFRSDGTQPELPGFAPEGRSFHQNQRYNDAFIGATAVDLVAPDGPDANHSHDGVRWEDVPAQGSQEALEWGLHCNVGAPPTGEPWHIQPIEIDGWVSWIYNGAPAPAAGYPYPGRDLTPEKEEDMIPLVKMERMYDSRHGNPQLSDVAQTKLRPGQIRKIPLGMAFKHQVRVTAVNAGRRGFVAITGVPEVGDPVLNFWDGQSGDGVMLLATPDGHGYLSTTVTCDVIVDVMARG